MTAKMIHLVVWSRSEDETVAAGVALGRVVRAGDVVGLDGELGAGKTRLVRGIAEGMGLDPAQVASPTYVLVHEYAARVGGGMAATPLLHVDAYRLSGPEDLDSVGWDRVMGAYGVVVVEWASRIAGVGGALEREPALARVRIQAEGAERRRLDVLAPRAWALRPEWRGVVAMAEATAGVEGRLEGLAPGWARCPVTGKGVAPGSATYPFFDERARMADLGRWLTGAYAVSRELVEEDLADPDLDPGTGGR